MTRRACLGALFTCLLLLGCEEHEYTITMRPRGNEVERVVALRALAPMTKIPRDVLDRIAEVYPTRVSPKSFSGSFSGELPQDVGGWGRYVHFGTDMGSVTVYIERFRGHQDLVTWSADLLEAVDQIIDMLIGWLEAELGDQSRFKDLRDFCDQQLRRDMRNVALHVWLAALLENVGDGAEYELLIKGGQLLAERGYISVEQLPTYVAGIRANDADWLLGIVRMIVAREMELSEAVDPNGPLGFLSDGERAKESLEKHVVTTELYREARERWKVQHSDTAEEEPEPLALVMGSVLESVWVPVFAPMVRVTVFLETGREPLISNGEWDEEAGRVRWSDTVLKDSDRELPMFCYAMWSHADEEFQREHFGDVVLEDGDLADYCFWRRSLSQERGREWDAFVHGLSAVEDVLGKLEGFAFSDGPLEGDGSPLAWPPAVREKLMSGAKGQGASRQP